MRRLKGKKGENIVCAIPKGLLYLGIIERLKERARQDDRSLSSTAIRAIRSFVDREKRGEVYRLSVIPVEWKEGIPSGTLEKLLIYPPEKDLELLDWLDQSSEKRRCSISRLIVEALLQYLDQEEEGPRSAAL